MDVNISQFLIKDFNLRYSNDINNKLTLGDDKSIISFLIKNLNPNNYKNILEELILPLGNYEFICFNFLQMVINTGFSDYYVNIINILNDKCHNSLRIMINNFFLNEKKNLDILQKLSKDILIKEYYDYLLETNNSYSLKNIVEKTNNLDVKIYITDMLYLKLIINNDENNKNEII